eukprot:scaffold359549_cov40-Prasinocladus_malaysianus.AAC.2
MAAFNVAAADSDILGLASVSAGATLCTIDRRRTQRPYQKPELFAILPTQTNERPRHRSWPLEWMRRMSRSMAGSVPSILSPVNPNAHH